jgi:histone deacetylase complex regulatory component SIN3
MPVFNEPDIEDALAYLIAVKSTCPERYYEFLGVMKAFKAKRLDTPGVIARVGGMFAGHEALLAGFSIFLPAAYVNQLQPTHALPPRLPLPPAALADEDEEEEEEEEEEEGEEGEEAPPVFDDAVVFVTTVKKQCTPETFRAFLALLNSYAERTITIETVCARVGGLFAGGDDLLRGFVAFLPDGVNQQAKDELMRTHSLRPGAGVASLSLEKENHSSK